jgi:hypothetical protein
MRKIAAVTSGLAVTAVVLWSATAAYAVPTQSVEFTAKYVRGAKKKDFGGLTLRTVLRISDTAGGLRPPLTNTTLRFPKGAVVNARYFKRCEPARLETRGARGCPSASKIGSGTSAADARPIVDDPVNAKITLYNGPRRNGNATIIIYAVPDLSSPLVIIGELKRDRGRYGYVLDVDVPIIPTLPGQPNAAVSFFDATTIDRKVRRRGRTIHYIEGPVLCNGTFFLLDGSFTYEGNVTNTVLEQFTLRGGPRCR